MNITRCKCSSLFQSNVCDCFSSSTIRDETTAGENTSSSLHSVVRKKNPELVYRVQSTHVFSPWTLSSKLQTSQCLIHTSCPAHSVSVLQQTFGCQCESLQRMLVNVGLHWLWGEHMTSLWRGFSFLLYTINRQNLNKEIKERDRRERQKMMEVETKQKADKEMRIKSKWSVWIHMETSVTSISQQRLSALILLPWRDLNSPETKLFLHSAPGVSSDYYSSPAPPGGAASGLWSKSFYQSSARG